MDDRVLICGIDGYIGWNLSMDLSRKGYNVMGLDNFSRREKVCEVGSESLVPIRSMEERLDAFEEIFGPHINFAEGDMTDYQFLRGVLEDFQPDSIINLAQMPSAPYSMIDVQKASWTTVNNTIGNLNLLWGIKETGLDSHLIKMGTMGEYGTPNIDIPEGFFEVEYNGRKDNLPFPRQAGSFYHWSKVFDSQHTNFASSIWGLRATDIMQGVIFGVSTNETEQDERLAGRFDYDGVFGTAINRFVVQAMEGIPLTPFGVGNQVRGFINIRDALKCLNLYLEHPSKEGEYRVFNQVAEQHRTINELAEMVKEIGEEKGYPSRIERIENPRIESEDHYYNVKTGKLKELGFEPSDIRFEIERMFDDLAPHQDRIDPKVIDPKVTWK